VAYLGPEILPEIISAQKLQSEKEAKHNDYLCMALNIPMYVITIKGSEHRPNQQTLKSIFLMA
jgi:hypothetical protein